LNIASIAAFNVTYTTGNTVNIFNTKVLVPGIYLVTTGFQAGALFPNAIMSIAVNGVPQGPGTVGSLTAVTVINS